MENKKILRLLNEITDFKFMTRKLNTMYNTEVLKPNLCD